MEVSAEQVEQIKQLLAEELPIALAALWEKKAPEMEAAIVTRVYRNVRKPLQREHAENRTRMKDAVREAEAAKTAARSAAANTEAVLARINDHREDTTQLRSEISRLQRSVDQWGEQAARSAGREEAAAAVRIAQARRHAKAWRWAKAIGSVIGAALSGDGVVKILEKWHKR